MGMRVGINEVNTYSLRRMSRRTGDRRRNHRIHSTRTIDGVHCKYHKSLLLYHCPSRRQEWFLVDWTIALMGCVAIYSQMYVKCCDAMVSEQKQLVFSNWNLSTNALRLASLKGCSHANGVIMPHIKTFEGFYDRLRVLQQ